MPDGYEFFIEGIGEVVNTAVHVIKGMGVDEFACFGEALGNPIGFNSKAKKRAA